MVKKRIGILRGGAGKHYEKSLKKGGEVISFIYKHLSLQYKTVDILVDKNNIWHIAGLPIKPEDLMNKVDLIWNASHPNFCQTLKNLPIPNIRIDASAFVENNHSILREQIKKLGVEMPKHIVLPVYQKDIDGRVETYANKKARMILEKFPAPWIVRPFNPDKNIAIHVVKTFPDLVKEIRDGVSHEESILIEELIPGKIAETHSLNNFRDENIYVMPPVENRDGKIISPGNFKMKEKEELILLARKIHQYLNVSYYTKLDFIINKKGIFLTNLEFLPDLEKGSSFTESCESVGTKAHKVIEHIIELTLSNGTAYPKN